MHAVVGTPHAIGEGMDNAMLDEVTEVAEALVELRDNAEALGFSSVDVEAHINREVLVVASLYGARQGLLLGWAVRAG